MSDMPSHGAMQARCGGCWAAMCHWLMASADEPAMATLPLHQGCCAVHSMKS
jgi:hypothetical protein